MELKSIHYFGEIKDFSDIWLISLLEKYYFVHVVMPGDVPPFTRCDLAINRMYTSSLDRYGTRKILRTINILKKIELNDIPVLNSAEGYILDLNRIKQYRFFRKHELSFVPTVCANTLKISRPIIFPVVLKPSNSGRNNFLPIIKERADLSSIPSVIKSNSVIQNFINKTLCFRTEVIGGYHVTFSQKLKLHNKKIFFHHGRTLKTPLNKDLLDRLRTILFKKGVRVFSIEYFIKNHQPQIIDFNLTSNYPNFLIKRSGIERDFSRAWLDVINEII